VQSRFISNVGFGLDNTIGLNHDLRDTLEVLREIIESEFFVKSALRYNHLYARLFNRKTYSPKENKLENQYGNDVYAARLYFDINFFPAWDTIRYSYDAADSANLVAWKCIIDVHGMGEFKAEFSQSEMDSIIQSVVAEQYTNIGSDAKSDVNKSLFTGLGWLAEKFGFTPYSDPANIKRVDFYAIDNNDHSFDKYDNNGILAGNYDNTSVKGMQYYVPWKSMAENQLQTQKLRAVIIPKTEGKAGGDSVVFVTTDGTPVTFVKKDSLTYEITIPPVAAKKELGIIAQYSYPDSTGKQITVNAGQVNLVG